MVWTAILKNLCFVKNRDFQHPAQWLRGEGLGTPKNRDIPCKLVHLATLLTAYVHSMDSNLKEFAHPKNQYFWLLVQWLREGSLEIPKKSGHPV